MVTTTSSDFKTIKAKVGKRAPVKANVTDTSFKRAGLHISKQVGISNTPDLVATSSSSSAAAAAAAEATTRSGLSIHQLFIQFKHPTIAVRISALKSFRSLLVIGDSSKNGGGAVSNSILSSYISEIVSSLLSVCCIDDEINVRKLAIQIFYDIFVCATNRPSTSSVTSLLQPFTSYMVAMISTGLNSLNVQQQFDNTIMVRYFIETIAMNHEGSSRGCIGHAIRQFLPPLTRLLGVVPNTATTAASTSSIPNQNKPFDSTTSIEATSSTTYSWVGGNAVSNMNTSQQQQHPMMIVGSMKKSKSNHKKRQKRQKVSLASYNVGDGNATSNTTIMKPPTPQQQQQPFTKTNDNITGNNNNNNTNPKMIVLMSIYTLFRSYALSTSSPSTVFSSNDDPQLYEHKSMTTEHRLPLPDVIIMPQQMRRTALLFTKSTGQSYHYNSSSSDEDDASTSLLSPNETLDLLVKVRDFMIEASQTNDSHSLLYCIMTVRFTLEYYNSSSCRSPDLTSENEGIQIVTQRCYKLCTQIGSYIVDAFRMYTSNNDHGTANNNVAVLSRTLLCIVNTIQPLTNLFKNIKQEKEISSNIKVWIQLITLHIQSTLDDDEATLLLMSSEQQQIETYQGVSSCRELNADLMTTKEMLSILTELLVRDDLRPFVTLRKRLIELFGAVFFTNYETNATINIKNRQLSSQIPTSSKLICSEVGRTAIVLCCRLVSMQQYDIELITQFFGPTNTSMLLRSISYYMVHLKAKYLPESTLCLSTLHHLLLRMDHHRLVRSAGTNCYADMIPTLREHVESILTVDETSSDGCCSTFEMYPEGVQRNFLCFCIMSNICTSISIKLFASICRRCYSSSHMNKRGHKLTVVSVTMATFIVESIHSIRKTMPMTIYLGFLIDCTGVIALKEPGATPKNGECEAMVLAIDQSLRCISSCLTRCGTKKVLPMLEPVFTVLLGNAMHDPKSIVNVIQGRAVFCLLAVFSLDVQRSNAIDGGSQSIFHFTSSEFKELLVDCILCLLSTGSTHLIDNASEISMNRWLSPILSLFVTDKTILARVLKGVLMKVPEFDSAVQGCIMEVWLSVLKKVQVTSILQSEGNTVMASILDNSNLTDAENPYPVVKRIVTELQIRCGGKK